MVEKKTKPVKAIKKLKVPANTPTETPVERGSPTPEPETEVFSEVTYLVDELVNELKKVEETEPTPGRDTVPPPEKSSTNPSPPPTDNTNKKRSDLIKLSEDGEVTQSVSYIKKASAKIVDKLYAEYEVKRMERANEFLTDMLISRFSNVLGGLDAVESSEALDTELQKDKLLKSDVGKVVAMVTPYLPCLGLLSGGITVGKHVYRRKTKVVEKKPEN